MVAAQVDQYRSAAADWERDQAIRLQKYDGLQGVFTMIGPAILPITVLVLLASLAVGDEFRHGTIRTTLLAAGRRRLFLAARLVSLAVLTVGLYLALALLGVALGAAIRLFGGEVSATSTPLDAVAGLAWLSATVLETFVLIAFCVALTVLLRSGALPLLLILLYLVGEVFIASLPVFRLPELLSGVPQATLSGSILELTGRLSVLTHAVGLADARVPEVAIELPLIAVAAVVMAWGVFFVVVADRRLRTMDITE
jgi:ABC-type transport system involved in multi-copper enzyme maturation permease subunit